MKTPLNCQLKAPSGFLRRFSWPVLVLAAFSFALPVHAEDRKVEKRFPPTYPELAKRMRIGGMVHVSVTVAPDGSVTAAKALSGNKMLTPAAEDAVRRWKFAPADAASTVDVDINFEVSN